MVALHVRTPPAKGTLRRQRRHGAVLEPADRRDLERAGWRTTLEYRENNTRGRDGRLLQVDPIWHAEAERDPADNWSAAPVRGVDFICATAESLDAVWSRLRIEAELADVRDDPSGTGDNTRNVRSQVRAQAC